MLSNDKNIEEEGERYRKSLLELIEQLKEERGENIQEAFRKAAETFRGPWEWMAEIRRKGRNDHWNVKLHFLWKAAQRVNRRARSSPLTIYWEPFKEKRKEF